jgi:hypothetical protein
MPTLSASDYTNYLKLKTAAVSYTNGQVPRKIQTTDQAVTNINVLNSVVKTSQAAFVTNPSQSVVTGLNYVRATPVVQTRSTPDAKSTVSWTSGTSGSVSSTTSSKFQRPGGLPANNVVGTYTRLPQNAGW